MDGQPHGFVLGGGAGLLAGDVNGDGYTDIITSQKDRQHIYDPEYRGLVRIYLHNKTGSMYNAQADLQIVGKNKGSELGTGTSGYGYLQGGDLNGDGKYDLVLASMDMYGTKNNEIGILWIYFGKTTPDTIPDQTIIDWNKGKLRSYFGEKYNIYDVNGDGYDDIICKSGREDSLATYNNYGIFLGNPSSSFRSTPDKIFQNMPNQSSLSGSIFYLDMNGDGCSEIFFGGDQPYPPFVWGRCGQDFLTKQNFLPDTVFTNEEPNMFIFATSFTSIGKFLGSGYKDYVICWSVSFQQQVIGGSCFLYRGGPGWQPEGIAYYGIQNDLDRVYSQPIPLGDITGDGLDDFALTSGYYSPTNTRYYAPIWFFKGDKTLIRTAVEPVPSISDNCNLEIFPNPIFLNNNNTISVKGSLKGDNKVSLSMYDIFGRLVKNDSKNDLMKGEFRFQLDIRNTPSGLYYISVRSENNSIVKIVSIVK